MSLQPRSPARTVQVEPASKRIPLTVFRMTAWQYHERSIQRMICGWARHQGEWEAVSDLHRHIWDQAEIVNRLRRRIEQFPGGKADAPVSRTLEEINEQVLHAPGLEDAIDGIYGLLTPALIRTYRDYADSVHPVHDAPTVSALEEIIGLKQTHLDWYAAYRSRHPHVTEPAYRSKVETAIHGMRESATGTPLKRGEPEARPVGVASGFRLPARCALPADARSRFELYPYIRCDFTRSVEARRLFWAIGYMREKNLAIDMVRWIFDGHHMPWEWTSDVSRHLWDESRHGDSGRQRLIDWGVGLDEVGMLTHQPDIFADDPPDGMSVETWAQAVTVVPEAPVATGNQGNLVPLTPEELYEAVFFVCMVAEQGHFVVKNESYDDFRSGHDLESAEMMLFDIIDETTHVQYGHKWLPELAARANLDNGGYRERAALVRKEKQAEERTGTERCQRLLPRVAGFPPWDHYQSLLERVRAKAPLTNAATCRERSPKPM